MNPIVGFVYQRILVFLPLGVLALFLGTRVVRIHGDEKVYVGQILEMAAAGNWLRQLQFDDVNYIKGPLFYWAGRVGLAVFGHSLPAALWINLALALLASWLLYVAFKRTPLGGFAAVEVSTSAVSAGFLFSAQMESAVLSLYTIALCLLVIRRGVTGYLGDLPLWIVAATAGLLKSPLHAALIGVGCVLFWSWEGTFRSRLRSPGSWMSWATGVAVCFLGYGFGLFVDTEVFLNTYWLRETLHRQAFVDNYLGFLFAAFVTNALPWSMLAFYVPLLRHIKQRRRLLLAEPLLRAALAIFIPTFFFFSAFGHYAPWYSVPLTGPYVVALIAVLSSLLNNDDEGRVVIGRMCVFLSAAVFMVAALMVVGFGSLGLPDWYPLSRAITSLAMLSLGGGVLLFCAWAQVGAQGRRLGVATLGISLSLAGVFSCLGALGERELFDLRYEGVQGQGPVSADPTMWYLNFEKSNYSEWGLVALALGRPVKPVLADRDVLQMQPGDVVLVPQSEDRGSFIHKLELQRPELLASTRPWRRWVRNIGGVKDNAESGRCSPISWGCFERNFWIAEISQRAK